MIWQNIIILIIHYHFYYSYYYSLFIIITIIIIIHYKYIFFKWRISRMSVHFSLVMTSLFLYQDFSKWCKDILQKMDKHRHRTPPPGNLKEYSPWLSRFQATDFAHALEIPGKGFRTKHATFWQFCLFFFLLHLDNIFT